MDRNRAKEILELNLYTAYHIKKDGDKPSYPDISKAERDEVNSVWSFMNGTTSFNDALKRIVTNGDDALLVEKARSGNLSSNYFWNIYPNYEELKRLRNLFRENQIFKYDSIISFLLRG